MFTYDKKYKFNETWFDAFIPLWDKVFEALGSNQIQNVLEVGCYEGRATIYLCEKVLNKGTNYDIVDTFGGSPEESGMKDTMDRFESDPNYLYNTFTHNISFHPEVNFNINRGYSQQMLPQLVAQGKKYDFIYIDASHKADDTLVDAYFAHQMINEGGILIFDDYGWKDPNQPSPIDSPEMGINIFTQFYGNQYQLVYKGYQVVLQKLKNG